MYIEFKIGGIRFGFGKKPTSFLLYPPYSKPKPKIEYESVNERNREVQWSFTHRMTKLEIAWLMFISHSLEIERETDFKPTIPRLFTSNDGDWECLRKHLMN